MKKTIYALLVGINEYPGRPLRYCVKDVEKMEAYLDGLPNEQVTVHKLKLTDGAATKEGIVHGIQTFLAQAKDEDTALFYYSGHGAFEETGGLFQEEHDGLLECIVSYHNVDTAAGYLLADKEIRFLLSKLPNNPHLVTVFDCCHAGDMVKGTEEADLMKRTGTIAPARTYKEFIFSKTIKKSVLKKEALAKIIGFKNHVHIAACGAHQSAWEDGRAIKGGVFTHYLLLVLNANHNKLNYQAITRWAKISIKAITRKAQHPTIGILGKGQVTAYSPWLNLVDPSQINQQQTAIVYNQEKGWYITIGQLMGVKEGELTIALKGKPVTIQVTKVNLTTALIEDPFLSAKIARPRGVSQHQVSVNTIYTPLTIFINNIDGYAADKIKIENSLQKLSNLHFTDQPSEAEFQINIFNELVYISLTNQPFRPLGQQIDLLAENAPLVDILKDQVNALIKWNHFKTLENPDSAFDKPPIKVELRIDGEKEWKDITNRELSLTSIKERAAGDWIQKIEIKVTNVSKETLHIGVLSLNSDLGISSNQWNQEVIELKKGASKLFYDHKESKSEIYFDNYKEIYNWKNEWLHFKFIINNYEDFTPALREYLQPGLDQPLTLKGEKGDNSKGERGIRERAYIKNTWGTLTSTIRLKNPEFNLISGDLATDWEHYQQSEEIAPFLKQLYFKNELRGLIAESTGLPNRTGEVENEKNLGGIKKDLGNFLDNLRRKRKFKRAKQRMPDKPILVAEGDSWFLYPFLVKDIIDHLMDHFPVRSLAAAGDTLENYKKEGQLLKEVVEIQPKYVLISGGGNDIIGPDIKKILTENASPNQIPTYYLNDTYTSQMAKLKALYEYFIGELKKHKSVQQVFLHGYDYIRTDHSKKFTEDGWVNKYMLEKGIHQASDREKVIRFLIDGFNQLLADLSQDDPFVTYLDLRTQVTKDQWFDEIHPNDEGFKALGDTFLSAINAVQNPV